MLRINLICVFLIFLIKNVELYRLETIISNFEKETDGFVFDKPTIIQRHYEAINSKDKNSASPLPTAGSQVNQYNQQLSEYVSSNIMQMALNIQTEIIKKDSKIQQSVFSPISIAGALSLLLLGSKGQTHQELSKLFGFSDNNPIFAASKGNSKQLLHDQFGLLIEDLLRDSPHPKRIRPVNKWKYRHSDDDLNLRYLKFFGNEHKIEIANGLFIQKDVKLRNEYKMMVEKIYQSEIMSVDFENDASNACKLINEWTKQKTNGRIKEIISSDLHPDTTMVIASALYFKAMWETSFIEAATSKRYFYPNGNDQTHKTQISSGAVLVDTMVNAGEFPYYESKEYGLRILGIPYRGNLTTMYIILPDNSNRQRLIETQQSLTSKKIEELIDKMEMRTVIITLPKMHLKNTINLKNIFSNIGVKSLFNSQTNDLSLMLNENEEDILIKNNKNVPIIDQPLIFTRFGNENDEIIGNSKKGETKNEYHLRNKRSIIARDSSSSSIIRTPKLQKFLRIHQQNLSTSRKYEKKIFVDDIIHKVDLIMNEKGTEGGATTISYLSRSDIEIDFIVDKPFLFFIRHDATKLPIFYGSIFQPI